MKKPLLVLSLAAAFSLASGPLHAGPVTFDPGAAGLPGAAFTFDALTGVEVSRIDNTFDMFGGLTFVENGLLHVTGAMLGNVAVAPGLDVDYTLYFAFTVTGGTTSLALPGVITGGSLTLYGVAGVSTFGFDGANVAVVDNGPNIPVALFTSIIKDGTIASTLVSPDPRALDLAATALSTVIPLTPGFIASPGGPLVSVLDAKHDSSTVQILNGGQVFLVDGGPDLITFTVAPEPSTLGSLGIGMAVLAFRLRRKMASARAAA